MQFQKNFPHRDFEFFQRIFLEGISQDVLLAPCTQKFSQAFYRNNFRIYSLTFFIFFFGKLFIIYLKEVILFSHMFFKHFPQKLDFFIASRNNFSMVLHYFCMISTIRSIFLNLVCINLSKNCIKNYFHNS